MQKKGNRVFLLFMFLFFLMFVPILGVNVLAQETTANTPTPETTTEQSTDKTQNSQDLQDSQKTQEPVTSNSTENKNDASQKEEEKSNVSLRDKVTENYIKEHINPQYTSAEKTDLVNLIRVKQTLFDKAKLKDEENLDIMFDTDRAFEVLLGQFLADIPVYDLSDNSQYYVAYINTMQNDTNATVRDYAFVINNEDAIVVDGCIYDQETGLAYIPKSAYKNENGKEDFYKVQVQLMQAVNTNNQDIDDVSLKTCSNTQTEDNQINRIKHDDYNLYDDTVTSMTEPGLQEDQIAVYTNGVLIEKSRYTYNSETGEVTIAASPVSTGNVTVEILNDAEKEKVKHIEEEVKKVEKTNGIEVEDVSLKTQTFNTASMYYASNTPIKLPATIAVGDQIDITTKYQYEGFNADSYTKTYGIANDGPIHSTSQIVTKECQFSNWVDTGTNFSEEDYTLKYGGGGFLAYFDAGSGADCKVNKNGYSVNFSSLGRLVLHCIHVTEANNWYSNPTPPQPITDLNNGETVSGSQLSPDGAPRNQYGSIYNNFPLRMRIYKLTNDSAIIGVIASRCYVVPDARETVDNTNQSGYALIKVPIEKVPTVKLIKKAGSLKGNDLEGARFNIYKFNKSQGEKGELINTFTSKKDGVEITDLEKGEMYYIEETFAPAGFEKINPILFEVNQDNSISFSKTYDHHENENDEQELKDQHTIVVADKAIRSDEVNLHLNKANIYGYPLDGAQLQVYKWGVGNSGNYEWVRYRNSVWTKDGGAAVLNDVDFPAKYKVVELAAPTVDGYEYKIFEGNCFFELDENGVITKSTGATANFTVESNLGDEEAIVNIVDESKTPLPKPVGKYKIGISKKAASLTGPGLSGASFEVRISENGAAIESLTSKSTTVYTKASLVENISYWLVETNAPRNYAALPYKIQFHFNSDGELIIDKNQNAFDEVLFDQETKVFTVVNKETEEYTPPIIPPVYYPPYTPPTIIEPPVIPNIPATPPKYHRISLRKADLNGEPLAGSCFEIYANINEAPIDTLYPGTNTAFSAYHLEEGQTYTLREKTAPSDHVPINDIKFTVGSDDKINISNYNGNSSSLFTVSTEMLTVKNNLQPHIVKIKKVNADGEILSGAELQVNEQGKSVAYKQFTTSNSPYDLTITAGSYVLYENRAPSGYETLDSKGINFSVDSSGYVHINSANNNIVKAEGDTLIVTDKPTPYELTINKVDPKGNNLEGAFMQLSNDPELNTQSLGTQSVGDYVKLDSNKSDNQNDDLSLKTQSENDNIKPDNSDAQAAQDAKQFKTATFITGQEFNIKCAELAGGLDKIEHIERIEKPVNQNNTVSTEDSKPIYIGYNADSKTIWWASEEGTPLLNKDSSSMFKDMVNLKSIGKDNKLDVKTDEVTDLSSAFENCHVLGNVDLSNLNMTSVINTEKMFKNCDSLTNIVFPEPISVDEANKNHKTYNTLAPINMAEMFAECKALTVLDIKILNPYQVQKADRVFSNCVQLKAIKTNENAFLPVGENIFENTPNLVGGNGTKWEEDHVNYAAAYIDDNIHKGYFTATRTIEESIGNSFENILLKTNETSGEPQFNDFDLKTQAAPTVRYQGHFRNKGDSTIASNGGVINSGTSPLTRMEGFGIQVDGKNIANGDLAANMLLKNNGSWGSTGSGWWTGGGSLGPGMIGLSSGWTYTDRQLIGLKIKNSLFNDSSFGDNYDLYYRVHVNYDGWQSWKKNGEVAGYSTKLGLNQSQKDNETHDGTGETYHRIEEFQAVAVPKYPSADVKFVNTKTGATKTVTLSEKGDTTSHTFDAGSGYQSCGYSATWNGNSLSVTPTNGSTSSTSTNTTGSISFNTSTSNSTGSYTNNHYSYTVNITPKELPTRAYVTFKYVDKNFNEQTIISNVLRENDNKYPSTTYSLNNVSGSSKYDYKNFTINAKLNYTGSEKYSVSCTGSNYDNAEARWTNTITNSSYKTLYYDVVVTPYANTSVDYTVEYYYGDTGKPLNKNRTINIDTSDTRYNPYSITLKLNSNVYIDPVLKVKWNGNSGYTDFANYNFSGVDFDHFTVSNSYENNPQSAYATKVNYHDHRYEQTIKIYIMSARQPADFYIFSGDPGETEKVECDINGTVNFTPKTGDNFNNASFSIEWDGLKATVVSYSGCQVRIDKDKISQGGTRTTVPVYLTREYVESSNLSTSYSAYIHNVDNKGVYIEGAGTDSDIVIYKSNESGVTGEEVSKFQQQTCGNYVMGLSEGYYLVHQNQAPEKYIPFNDVLFKVDANGAISIVNGNNHVSSNGNNIFITSDMTQEAINEGNTETTVKTISWETSKDEPKTIALPVGEFTLKELTAPENYAKIANMKLRINDDGSITVVEDGGNTYTLEGTTLTVTDKYIPHDIIIDKTDMAWRSISGADIKILNKDTNQIIESWTSDKTTGARTISLYTGTYIFRETNKPIGYKQLENDLEFTVTVDGKVQIANANGNVARAKDNKLSIADDYDGISVMFNKLDIHGNKIAGAELNIVDSNNEIVASWISEKDKTKELHLPIGSYTFKEVDVPKGYAQIADISFEVNDEGHIVLPNGETDHVSIVNDNTLNVVDDYVKAPIEFSKLNPNSELIEGAVIQILQEGSVVHQWTTTNEKHQVELFPGTYVFKELSAPDTYSVVADFSFEIEPDGNVVVKNSNKNDVVEGYRKLDVVDKLKNKSIEISKLDPEANELYGAHIQILSDDAPKPLYDFTSTAEIASFSLSPGEYIFHEESAPDNFAKVSDIRFKVDSDGNVSIVSDPNEMKARAASNRLIVTDPYANHDIQIQKADIKGNALEGAHMQILKSNDSTNPLYDWTSTSELKTVSLYPGDYVLHEVKAPTNYTEIEDVPFTILSNGFLKITDSSVTNAKVDGNKIIAKDPYIPHNIKLSKIGLNGEKVIGATVKIDQMQEESYIDPDSIGIIDTVSGLELDPVILTRTVRKNIWQGSSAASNTVSLYPGEYIFVEESAPTNYAKVTEFTFEVSVDGKVSIKSANGNTVSGNNDTLSVTDPYVPHDIEVSKVNLYGDEIAGAHIQVKQGTNVKADWTSEAGKNKTVSLLPGNYSFVEVSPPQANYAAITTTVDFTVGIDGTVTITALNGNTAEATGSKLSVTDPFVPHNVVFSKINPEGTRLANAVIQIKQGSDVKDSWTTASNQDKTSSLLPGDYIYHEATAPTHYLAVKDITFNVGVDGTVTVKNANNETVTASSNKLTVTDPYEPKDIEIKKIDVWNNQIAGARIQIKQGNNVLADWRTEANKSKTVKLTKGTYTFHEEGSAPSGYLAVTDITFEVSLDGKVTVKNANGNTVTASNNVLTVTDKHAPHDITFKKVNPWNERISGVRIQIKQGSTTKADWTTSTSNDKVVSLLPGDYVFHEVSGPSNYYAVSDISFSIDITGKVTVTNANSNTVVGGNGTLTVTDPFKERTISIRKENLAGSRIAGAVLQIKDKTTGEVKQEWTSSSSSNKSITILPGTYIFHEVTAPTNYKPVTDFEFKVDPNGNVTVADNKGNTLSTSGSTLEVTDMIVADISVSKEVQGKLGDSNLEFTYVFTSSVSDTYPIVITKQDGSTQESTIQNGGTFKLKNHEKAVIKNVIYNTKYSITEKGTNDYRAAVSYKGANNQTATASANALMNNPSDVSVGTKTITVTGTETYQYTNAKDELVPTGINEIILPFVLLFFVALIGAITFVFSTKKNKS